MLFTDSDLAEVVKKYSLSTEDIYRANNDTTLVTQRGIRKIISKDEINISKRVEFEGPRTVVTCRAECGGAFEKGYKFFEATGEADPSNTTFKFPVAVAEARAQSRAVLSFIKLYEKGVIGEHELDMETEGQAILSKRKEQIDIATKNLMEKIKGTKKL